MKKKVSSPKKAKISTALADSEYMQSHSDPAHSPGHRKLNLKYQFAKKKR